MQVIKALIGGLVGGCLGAYVASQFGPVRGALGPWLILLAGIGAGLGVRLFCGTHRSFVTGIVSAVTAIVGVVVISYTSAAVALRSSDELGKPLEIARSVEASIDQNVTEIEAEPIAQDDPPSTAQDDPQSATQDESQSRTQDDTLSVTTEGAEEPAEDELDDATFEPPTAAPYEMPDNALADNALVSTSAPPGMMDLIANAVSALIAFVIGTGSAPLARREPEAT